MAVGGPGPGGAGVHEGTLIAQGAEAQVRAVAWMGRTAVAKDRVAKPFRHPQLDGRLRTERTRDEANLIVHARRAGVAVPVLYDVDRQAARMVLEAIDGPALRQVLPDDPDDAAAARLHALGEMVGRLHDAGLTHGDLTTSNVLVPEPAVLASLVLIDFGLGQFSEEGEPRGVDLHLVEEALEATDPRADALMAAFLDGYGTAACAPASVQRLEAIRLRGRYREAV